MAAHPPFTTQIHRYYINVRPLTSSQRTGHVELPLLSTLPREIQQTIKAYLRPADRLMSLSSALLKYYFIHRTARIPWSEVNISRTPKPHRRPYWSPPNDWTGEGGLEFNVTHQAGLVGLVGCRTPVVQSPEYVQPLTHNDAESATGYGAVPEQVRLGVDVACIAEPGRSPDDITTQAKLDEWLDIFGEMFSEECLDGIRKYSVTGAVSEAEIMQTRLRRFYAFWALKEAYIKMVGEGLLADWLQKLEFEGVDVPMPSKKEDWDDDGFSWALRSEDEVKWTPPDKAARNIRSRLYGREVEDVTLELIAYEKDFLWASASRGVKDEGPAEWIKLDIEKNIRPCAEGRCRCLDKQKQNVPKTMVNPVSATMIGTEKNYHIIAASTEP